LAGAADGRIVVKGIGTGATTLGLQYSASNASASSDRI
jgi:hypothetical protein